MKETLSVASGSGGLSDSCQRHFAGTSTGIVPKYIRFFSGLVLIILLMTPLLRLTDMEDSFRSRVQEQNMEQESASFLEEIREKQEEGKGEMTLETEEKEQIEVEEIQIGE